MEWRIVIFNIIKIGYFVDFSYLILLVYIKRGCFQFVMHCLTPLHRPPWIAQRHVIGDEVTSPVLLQCNCTSRYNAGGGTRKHDNGTPSMASSTSRLLVYKPPQHLSFSHLESSTKIKYVITRASEPQRDLARFVGRAFFCGQWTPTSGSN